MHNRPRRRRRAPRRADLSRLAAAALLCVAAAATAAAQEVPDPQRNSPFSRFGVGDLVPFAYSTQLAMGGIGVGFSDRHIASPTNPASLGALRYTSFQVGVGLERSQLEGDGGLESENLTGNLQYLSLAFPLQNSLQRVLDGKTSKWRNGMMIAVAPYSNIGYNVQLASQQALVGEVVTRFQGSGGYYRLQWGNGLEYEGLRAGLNLSFIFGRANNQEIVFVRAPDSTGIGASVLTRTDALRGRGLETQLGAQYDWVLRRNDAGPLNTLTFGASATIGGQLDAEASETVTTRDIAFELDTVRRLLNSVQTVQLPNRVALGAYYQVKNKLGVGFDYERVSWSSFDNSLRPGERLVDVNRYSFGAQWIPNYQAYGKYWQRIRYRAGAYSNQDPRPGVNPEVGVTFGLGLPIVRPREEVSYVNLALNAGRFGTEADISQRYVRLTVGFTLTDNSWFYKRRFN